MELYVYVPGVWLYVPGVWCLYGPTLSLGDGIRGPRVIKASGFPINKLLRNLHGDTLATGRTTVAKDAAHRGPHHSTRCHGDTVIRFQKSTRCQFPN